MSGSAARQAPIWFCNRRSGRDLGEKVPLKESIPALGAGMPRGNPLLKLGMGNE